MQEKLHTEQEDAAKGIHKFEEIIKNKKWHSILAYH